MTMEPAHTASRRGTGHVLHHCLGTHLRQPGVQVHRGRDSTCASDAPASRVHLNDLRPEASVRTRWWSASPVAVQLGGQFLGPLLWEEEFASVDLDDLPGTGDQVAQAVRQRIPRASSAVPQTSSTGTSRWRSRPATASSSVGSRAVSIRSNTSASIRHRLPDDFRGLSGTPVVSDPTARRFRGEALTTLPLR